MEQSSNNSNKQNTTMAAIAYILFLVPILTGDVKKSEFVKYHTKQGLTLFCLWIIVGAMDAIMPFYLWFTVNQLLNLGLFVFLIIGIVNAVSGKQQPLPLIGKYADLFKF